MFLIVGRGEVSESARYRDKRCPAPRGAACPRRSPRRCSRTRRRHPIHRRRAVQRLHGQHADVRADHADFDLGVFFLQASGEARVIGKGGRAGVQHGQFILAWPAGPLGRRVRPSGGASIRRLPGTIAAGCASQVGYQNDRNLAPRLIARAGAAIKAFDSSAGSEKEYASLANGPFQIYASKYLAASYDTNSYQFNPDRPIP